MQVNLIVKMAKGSSKFLIKFWHYKHLVKLKLGGFVMAKEIIIKIAFEWLDCVNVEGVGNEILGSLYTSYEKVDEIEQGFEIIDEKMAPEIYPLYDAEGVDLAYDECVDDPKHCVKPLRIYSNEDVLNSDHPYEYKVFDVDSYSKFCYLFKKENRLFFLHY